MSTRRTRTTILILALTTVALFVSAAGASAAIVSSEITEPKDGSFFLKPEGFAEAEITIRGTFKTSAPLAPGEGPVLDCYSTSEKPESVEPVEEEDIKETTTDSYSFTVKSVPIDEIGEAPCVLRAVPPGEEAPLAPGEKTPFEGPRLTYSTFEQTEYKPGVIDGFEAEERTLSAVFETNTAGVCGLGSTNLVNPQSLEESDELFECAGELDATARAAVQVDGHNAYDPYWADFLTKELHPAGLPAPEATRTLPHLDPEGVMTLQEKEPLVECVGTTVAFPETTESCKEFKEAGVTLERTWTPADGGRLISMSDTGYRQTDLPTLSTRSTHRNSRAT